VTTGREGERVEEEQEGEDEEGADDVEVVEVDAGWVKVRSARKSVDSGSKSSSGPGTNSLLSEA